MQHISKFLHPLQFSVSKNKCLDILEEVYPNYYSSDEIAKILDIDK